MYFLLDCSDPTFTPLFNILKIIIHIIWWGIPIALIIFASIDFGKAVITSKEDEVKKYKKSALNRLIYAVLVFAVVWIVKTVMHLIVSLGFTSDVDATGWENCWNQIF